MKLTVAVTQMTCSWDRLGNLDKAAALVVEAAGQGARLILLQELFETPYFCTEQDGAHRKLAAPFSGNPILSRFADLAKELGVVLPISFFERDGNTFYNSIAIADADGTVLGLYRKSHIPDGPGYQEKFFFTPGDTGFRVWDTAVGRIGVGICWDQWFPEAARSMALMGAEILLYPTAIGSEPLNPSYDSQSHWQTCMQGHAADATAVWDDFSDPVVAVEAEHAAVDNICVDEAARRVPHGPLDQSIALRDLVHAISSRLFRGLSLDQLIASGTIRRGRLRH